MSTIQETIIPILAYKISTPITNIDTNTTNPNFYSKIIFDNFLELIIKSAPRAYMDGSKYIDLVSYKPSSDNEVMEGKIHTTRYGTLNSILNVETKKVVGTLNPTDGVVNEINFVICRKTGLLLLQSDPFRIATRNYIDEYLTRKQILAKDLISAFNKSNNPNHIYNEFIYTIETLVDNDFYSQLANLNNIKELKLSATIEKSNDNSALQRFMRKSSDNEQESIDGITEIEFSVVSKSYNSGLRNVERFVKNVIDLEKVSKLKAVGYNKGGKPDNASFDIKPIKFFVKTTKNSHGILDQSKIIEGMIDVVKRKNPIKG